MFYLCLDVYRYCLGNMFKFLLDSSCLISKLIRITQPNLWCLYVENVGLYALRYYYKLEIEYCSYYHCHQSLDMDFRHWQ